MNITRRAEYAVRAVLDLALHARPDLGVRSSEIARRTGVPKKFLEAVMLDLRKAGLISSKRGPDGGHWLARDPARLTLGAVIRAIDGASNVSQRKAHRQPTPAEVCLEAFWARVDAGVRSVVDTVTIDDLRRQADTRGALDFSI